jgi:ankyrin repeat protein
MSSDNSIVNDSQLLDLVHELWSALTIGDAEKVRNLLTKGANKDAREKDGTTPLRWAALAG